MKRKSIWVIALALAIAAANLPAFATVKKLDEENLKNNIFKGIVRTLEDQNVDINDPGFKRFTTGAIKILAATPVTIGELPYYVVQVAFQDPDGKTAENDLSKDRAMVLTVDPSGTFQFAEISEISTKKSATLEARRAMVKADLPVDFGDVVYEGDGGEDVVFISDVFCPFCRDAFQYLTAKKSKIKKLKIVHFPLVDLHPGATIVSLAGYDAKEKLSATEYEQFVTYIYSELTEPQATVRGPLEAHELALIEGILAKYPKLKEEAQDVNGYVYYLKGKYATKLAKEKEKASSLGISATPFLFVNGYMIRGFNKPELDGIFK